MLSACFVERHNVLLATCTVRNSEEAAYAVSTFVRHLKLKASLEGIDLSYVKQYIQTCVCLPG